MKTTDITEEYCNKIPNAETLEAIQELEDMKSGKIKGKLYSSIEELMADLEDET